MPRVLKSGKIKFTRFDAAKELRTEQERAIFLSCAQEEGDPAYLAHAQQVVLRSRLLHRRRPG